MTKFHNPYAFVPATGKVNGQETPKTPYSEIAGGNVPFVRHDRWDADALSGRIVCRLFLHSPLVLGGKQIPGQKADGAHPARAGEVEPYRNRGRIAIPGNSLRGMIGSVAETISQSALRVLDDTHYSVRKTMQESLSAIGMLEADGSGFKLYPLTIPTPPRIKGNGAYFELPDEKWKGVFVDQHGGQIPLHELLWPYISGYQKIEPDGDEQPFIEYAANTFLEREKPSSSLGRAPLFYAKLKIPDPNWTSTFQIARSQDSIYVKNYGQYHMLLGRHLEDILTEEQWNESGKPEEYIPGILRVLGIDNRTKDMPTTKKHELFIPLPNTVRKHLAFKDGVLERFIAMCQEREAHNTQRESPLPFALENYPDWKPRDGALVFFDVDKNQNGEPEVSEISISSIWRRYAGTTYDYFKYIANDLLPWNAGRTSLTPAECLFGVVQEDGGGSEGGKNLASRVRFHDALPDGDIKLGDRVQLKILSSPKPPSPAMYFHRPGGGYISKSDMKTGGDIEPNGRKRYIPHRSVDIDARCWKTKFPEDTKTLNQKLLVNPIPERDAEGSRTSFHFHIDFENISPYEMDLLLASIEPQRAASGDSLFLHRLGLGKPLGLGHAEVKISGVYLVDRSNRYAPDGLKAQRYHQYWSGTVSDRQKDIWSEEMKRRYRLEAHATEDSIRVDFPPILRTLIDDESLAMLLVTGAPDKVSGPVCYPFTDNQGEFNEKDGFKWFGANDHKDNHGHRQMLPTVEASSPLGTLKSDFSSSPSGGDAAPSPTGSGGPPERAEGSAVPAGPHQGSVMWFDDKKGFGFIKPDGGGEDIFVHFNAIHGNGHRTLTEGQRVSYSVAKGKKGLEAHNVIPKPE